MYSTGNMVITLYSDRYKPIKLYKTSTLQKAFYLIHFYCLFKFILGIYIPAYIFVFQDNVLVPQIPEQDWNQEKHVS